MIEQLLVKYQTGRSVVCNHSEVKKICYQKWSFEKSKSLLILCLGRLCLWAILVKLNFPLHFDRFFHVFFGY